MKLKFKSVKLSSVINIEAFCIVLLGGALLTWLEPKLDVSEIEKRSLTPFPSFASEKLWEGNFTDSLELYFADHFVHRDDWVVFTAALKNNFGIRQHDLMIYQSENPELAELDSLALADSLDRMKKKDQVKIKKDPTGQPPELKNSILIYNGMAFQLFGRQREAEDNFAATINSYKTKLGDSVRVFACVVPSPIDFYLPEEYKSKSNYEKPSIDYIYSKLNHQVLAIDAYTLLSASTNDFIYFKTDHHWTARGAHKAYQAFCLQAGLEAVPLELYQRFVRKSFLGSLYSITLDARLKKSGDSLEYFFPPLKTEAWRYPDRNLKTIIPTEVVIGRLGRGGSYLTFLGGDYPLTHIITEEKNGKRILLIKDSYGNAFAPFLTMHYEEIFVIDYRSFDSNVIKFMERQKISDLIFLHNVAVANTKFTASRESYLMRIRDLHPKIKGDSIRENPTF
jgi:DHHW protein